MPKKAIDSTLALAAALALVGCSMSPTVEAPYAEVGPITPSPTVESQTQEIELAPGDNLVGSMSSKAPGITGLSMDGVHSNRFVAYSECDGGGTMEIEVFGSGDLGPQPLTVSCDGTTNRFMVVMDPVATSADSMVVSPPKSGEWAVSLAWRDSDDFSGGEG